MYKIDNPMIEEIKLLLENARKNVAQQVNTELIKTYWQIGRIIVTNEQKNEIRAEYGQETLREPSKVLTKEFGKGFSHSNLQNMRAFYLTYEKCQSVTGKLTWTHYCELLSISDASKRRFYERESINSCWSVREMKRQIHSSLYERLLLSAGDINKKKDCADVGLTMTVAFTVFAKTVSREKRIPFEITADPFYSGSNMAHLRSTMDRIETEARSAGSAAHDARGEIENAENSIRRAEDAVEAGQRAAEEVSDGISECQDIASKSRKLNTDIASLIRDIEAANRKRTQDSKKSPVAK